jgi:transposase-like protein
VEKYKTVKEIAKEFGVTSTSVRNWIKAGLQYKTERVVGIKPRMVIKPSDVKKYLGLGIGA